MSELIRRFETATKLAAAAKRGLTQIPTMDAQALLLMLHGMTKVYCADTSCKFNNDKGVCTQKSIALSWHSVVTVNDGRQEFSRCKTYEKSEVFEKIEEFMAEHPFIPEGK